MVPPMSSRRALIAVLAALVPLAGCDKGGGEDSKKIKALEDRLAKFEKTETVPALQARITKLEEEAAKYREMLAAIKVQYDRQAAQQKAEEENDPAEDAVFAVDITGNEVEGPKAGALVTIIEAWDFG
jgi:hypothetical protein